MATDAAIDTSVVMPMCTTWSAWSAPALVAEFNTGVDEYGPSITPDGLIACFTSDRPGGAGNFDVYCSERASTADAFGVPVNAGMPNDSSNDRNVVIASDGLELFFTSTRPGGVGLRDIYRATRSTRAGSFGVASHVFELATVEDDEAGALSPDGLRLYFSRVVAPDAAELIVASRPSRTSPFDTFVELDEINSVANDDRPTPRPDELEIVWGTTRTGGMGGRDLWRATRTDRSAPFGPPVHLPQVSSPLDELAATISADGTEMYLNYNMELSSGGPPSDVWRATRTCLD